jgi:hypothetical protein
VDKGSFGYFVTAIGSAAILICYLSLVLVGQDRQQGIDNEKDKKFDFASQIQNYSNIRNGQIQQKPVELLS